ncbi:MAG: aconitase X [Deltaproteobacteria bacterium]
MHLTEEEKAILDGNHGQVKQKAMQTLVKYGETFGAERLAPITRGHVVMPAGASFIPSQLEILESLVGDGLKFAVPTSINPRPFEQSRPGVVAKMIYNRQEQFEKLQNALGVIPCYTCAPYLGDNVPGEGEILGWAESSAVVFANSVIGARTNRNSSMVEICSSILARTPEFGLLLDENRKADYLVEVDVSELHYSLIGFCVGSQVGEKVPYYTGLPGEISWGDLKDMGAASAASGAVGLYHVENVTPEAVKQGRSLLKEGCPTIKVTDTDIKAIRERLGLPGQPNLIIIGCPHLTLEQLSIWSQRIDRPVATETWLVTAPSILQRFRETAGYEALTRKKVRLMTLCSLAFMDSPHLKRLRVLTNSGKLAYYTDAYLGTDGDCLQAMYGKGR